MRIKKIKKSVNVALTAFVFLALSIQLSAQPWEDTPARNMVWEQKLERQVGFLSDSLCQGRSTGTRGNADAAFWIIREFSKAGLMQFDGVWGRHFYAGRGLVGHNIIGMMPGSLKTPCRKYIIVGAHYDHIGKLGNSIYPGADANASGTVALTCLAEMFSVMKTMGKTFGHSIIFVAFDAKEMNMAGSEAFWRMIEYGELIDPVTKESVRPENISLMVNMDQIGSSLSPLHSGRKDYIIMLGNNSLTPSDRGLIETCNKQYALHMDVGLSYYGSENFTRIFYRLSDQKVFIDNGIPAVLFTSGITMNTNKTRDTAASLDYPVFKKRIWLIYHWLCRIAR